MKTIQIRYQIWYRFRNKVFPVKYRSPSSDPVNFQKLSLSDFPKQFEHYKGSNRFEFLNVSHDFGSKINWNFENKGKLWTYHLNYFDFLNQSFVDRKKGDQLLNSFLNDISKIKDGLEPYPISLRCINWIKFFAIHDYFPEDQLKHLHEHFRILIKKLEYHLLGNHLLENAFCLAFGAVLFHDNKKLNFLADKLLSEQLNEQVLKDGAHFELSPMYHSILLQRALDVYNILINNKHNLSKVENLLNEKIQIMMDWLFTIQFRNGDLPHVNDSVSGQALDTDLILNYGRNLGFVPKLTDLNESGYRKREWNNFELFMDVGDIKPDYQPGHAHSDSLNFILHVNNNPIIVDRRISTYEKNSLRDEERSTSSHNTVKINGIEQSDVWGGFRVGKRAETKILKEKEDMIIAQHNGYDHIGCSHKRNWTIISGGVKIKDTITGDIDSAHAKFHLHPGLSPKKISKHCYQIGEVSISFGGANSIKVDSYFFNEGFNLKESAFVINVDFSDELRTKITL